VRESSFRCSGRVCTGQYCCTATCGETTRQKCLWRALSFHVNGDQLILQQCEFEEACRITFEQVVDLTLGSSVILFLEALSEFHQFFAHGIGDARGVGATQHYLQMQ